MRRSLTYFLLFVVVIPSVAQNNILNNGGFESGLMCYSDWIWSITGIDFKGDYRFSLSNDAHSGAYSAEINCQGPDCGKAAIISDYIPAPANQSYQLSVWAKCPTGRLALVDIQILDNGTDVPKYFTCNGNWNLNQVSFQYGPTAGYFYFYIFNVDHSPLLVDDLVLTYGDGTAPQHLPLYAGKRNVSISGQTVMVDGAPFLSLGFFDVPYNDLEQVAATGANTINGLTTYNATDCFNTSPINYLDKAYELGLNFIPDSSTTAWLNMPSVLPGATQTFAPHLANIGWFLADEPDLAAVSWHYIPASTFLTESAAAKTNTSLPMVADFQHATYGALSDIAGYNGSADIWMAEPYGPDFGSVNYAINLFNTLQPRPIWLAQDDIDAALIVPKAYWVVIGGATGIQYFTWTVFKANPAKLAAVEQAFSELKGLNNVIFGQKIDSRVNPPAGIASMARFDPGTGTAYILSANSVAQTMQGSFAVQGLAAGQTVKVLYENRTITASAGSFFDTFAGVSRHVYAISSFNVNNPPPSVVIETPVPAASLATGSMMVSGWAIDNAVGVGTGITGVKVLLDGTPAGNATYGISRPDVCAVYPGRPGCPNVGFSYVLNVLPPGPHTITVTATDTDGVPDAWSTSVTVTGAPAVRSYTVSGQVTAGGVGLNGVTINVNGSQNTSTTTDASGNYRIVLGVNGTYTLAPVHAGYSFSQPATFSNLGANQVANFTGIAEAGLEFYPVTPCRVADTRSGAGFSGAFGPPSMTAGSTRTFNIPASSCGIPVTAAAYSLNFTVVPPEPLGNLTTWPAGQPMPNVSTLNDPSGTVVANAAIVPAGAGGTINVFVTHATDVLFDINGYFAPPSGSGLQFYPVVPCRVADTRAAAGFSGAFGPPSMTAGSQRSFPIPSSTCGIPATAAAYSLNLTVVPSGPLGVLTTWPAGQAMPHVSTLNSYNGMVLANAAIVPAGAGGAITLYVNSQSDVLFDINGYFAPPSGSGLNFYPVTPCRIADTRTVAGFAGVFGSPSMVPGNARSFPVPSSVCGIPATAAAYSLNFTVVPPGPLGVLTTWPAGQSMPSVSTLNSYNGTVLANGALVSAGTGGAISVYVNNPTDLLLDVNGYFAH